MTTASTDFLDDSFAPTQREGRLVFAFHATGGATKYDHPAWNLPTAPAGKRVDFIALRADSETTSAKAYFVEVKDFHQLAKISKPNAENYRDLADTFSQKVTDTLAALPVLANEVGRDSRQSAFARAAHAVARRLFVLHFEPYDGLDDKFSHLRAASPGLLLKISQNLNGASVLILDRATTATAGVPWSVLSAGRLKEPGL